MDEDQEDDDGRHRDDAERAQSPRAERGARSHTSAVTSAKTSVAPAAASARESLAISRHGRLARSIPASSRALPRTTAATSRMSTSSSSGRRVRSARAISCRRRRTRSAPLPAFASPELEALSDEPVHEPHDGIACAPSHLYGSERRERDDGDSVGGAGVGDDRAATDAQGQVRQHDPQVPVLAEQSLVRDVDDLGAGTAAGGRLVGHDRDLPPHLGGNPGRQLGREFLGEVPAEFLGDPRGGHQTEPDRLVVASRRGAFDERLSDRGVRAGLPTGAATPHADDLDPLRAGVGVPPFQALYSSAPARSRTWIYRLGGGRLIHWTTRAPLTAGCRRSARG